MAEPHLVEAMAAKIIYQHGGKSLAMIAKHCQMANAIGDQSSLQTWRDIAAAVERLLPGAGMARPASSGAAIGALPRSPGTAYRYCQPVEGELDPLE